jgi:hypothetical protein
MSLALVKAHLSAQLGKLGTAKDAKSQPPHSTSNTAALVYEYFVADFLCSLATKRKEAAKKACQEAGILVEPPEGETETVYKDETIQIIGQTKTASQTIDKAKLNSELMKEVGATKAQAIIANSSKKNKPATSFSFVSSDGSNT